MTYGAGPLDAVDPAAFRALAHRALDDALDAIADIRDVPAWQVVPPQVRAAIESDPIPYAPSSADAVYAEYATSIAPYAVGNRHPRFFGWVHGAGTPSGVVAEMLAAALNINAGGRDHAAVYVERRLIAWFAEIFGFPSAASGIVTSGTSMANLIAMLVARRAALGASVRTDGVAGSAFAGTLTAYASTETHHSVADAFDVVGLGSNAVRSIPVDARFAMDVAALRGAIAADRAAGNTPFAVIGTAGSAGIGAVDDLAALADVSAQERCWFHVDGAFGALAILSPNERNLLAGIERADSIAFDFHKWLHVPYDAGCVLVRDRGLHRSTFAAEAPYLARLSGGTAGGDPWFTDFGPDLSRGFRALKVWFTLKEFGLDRFGALIAAQCAMARGLADRIAVTPRLEMLAPVALNIVCFRYVVDVPDTALDAINTEIVVDLQTRGVAVPSMTRIAGRLAIRLNVMNHRTTIADLHATIAAVVESGDRATNAFVAAAAVS